MIKLILAASLCAATAQAKTAEKAMDWKGQYGGPVDPGVVIATDAAIWTRLWRTLGRKAPPLDFKKHFAVAVFAGERPTGGYAIEFLDPAPKGRDLVVRYRIKAPSGFATQAIAQPWGVRAFARARGKVSAAAVPEEGRTR
ncbi:MAG: protease complex subunit PrcB family protein [Elusimicrobia bacterium]|nr:protease complex subunit PrcB family protein [Elusimicrobiota bacterium]